MIYLVCFLAAATLTAILTPLVRRFASRYGFWDIPRLPRNLHTNPVPKLGGLAIFIAVTLVIGVYAFTGSVDYNIVPLRFFWAIFAGGAILIIGGILDDKYDLPPSVLWIFPALASLIVVLSGIGVGITLISNPFGDPFSLKFLILGVPASAIFAWLWMMGMIFTTKFLDGLDGLVSGIGLIASLTIFFLSLTPEVSQSITATLSLILAGSLAAYLIYAFHPASIFLGEGGSTYVGFMLGILSIILGGKIATAFLVMGIPILDVALVIAQRIWTGRSPFKGDRLHLHMRLLDLGLSQRKTALVLYGISMIFGFTAVFLQSMGKLIALIILFGVMSGLAGLVIVGVRRKQRQAARIKTG